MRQLHSVVIVKGQTEVTEVSERSVVAWAQPLGGRGSGPPQNLDGPPTFYIAF